MWDTHTVCVQSFSSTHSVTMEKLKDISAQTHNLISKSHKKFILNGHEMKILSWLLYLCASVHHKILQDSREIKGNFYSTSRGFDWISNRSESWIQKKNERTYSFHFLIFISLFTHACLQRHNVITVILMCHIAFFLVCWTKISNEGEALP